MTYQISKGLVGAVLLAGASTASAGIASGGHWQAVNDIVGQTSTATVAGGGNPLYIPPKPQYSGSVGILMDYGADGAFVCSGSLVNNNAVVTAAHCVSDGTAARPRPRRCSSTAGRMIRRSMPTVRRRPVSR